MGRIRFEGPMMILDGYKPGGTAHKLETAEAEELKRLTILRGDLDRALTWLNGAREMTPKGDPPSLIAEALNEAALMAFCRCFESTAAERMRPLKLKKVFTAEQKMQFERLRKMRNKMVGHDERLYGGVFSVVIRDIEMKAEDVVGMALLMPFSAFPELHQLWELANKAYEWVETARLTLIERMKADFDNSSLEERQSLPMFTAVAVASDLLAPDAKGGRA